jgi:hypothetical protein
MSKIRLIIGCGLLLICFCSCRPKGVLSRKEMTDLLYDLHLAEAACSGVNVPVSAEWRQGLAPDFFRDMAYESVLRKHHVSESDFYKSVAWYSRHLRLYSKVYADIHRKMDLFQQGIDLGQFDPVSDLKALGLDPAKVKAMYRFGSYRKDTTAIRVVIDSVSGFAAWAAPQWLYTFSDTTRLELYPKMTLQGLFPVALSDSLLVDSLSSHRDELRNIDPKLQNVLLSNPNARQVPIRSSRSLQKSDQIRMRFKSRAREQKEQAIQAAELERDAVKQMNRERAAKQVAESKKIKK